MKLDIKCKYITKEGLCKNKGIKRSWFGFGKRRCKKNFLSCKFFVAKIRKPRKEKIDVSREHSLSDNTINQG